MDKVVKTLTFPTFIKKHKFDPTPGYSILAKIHTHVAHKMQTMQHTNIIFTTIWSHNILWSNDFG